MAWPWSIRAAPRVSVREPATLSTVYVEETLTVLAPQVAAVRDQLPAFGQHIVVPLLPRLVAFCWDLPASAAHHHSRPFGLLTHSLEVAAHGLAAFSQSSLWWAKVPDPAQRHRTQEHWRLGIALAGLCHDLGKVFDMTVTVEQAGAPGGVWNPLADPLLTFLLAHQHGDTLPASTLHWQPGRGMRHAHIGTLAATLLLTRADLLALTVLVAHELWTFLGGAPEPGNVFRQLLTQPDPAGAPAADGQSVRADLAAVPPAQPLLAAQVLATLAQCCRAGPLRVNQFPGHVFVQDAVSLVVVPEALKPVRQHLAAQGIAVPSGTVLYNDLAVAGYVLGEAGQNVAHATFPRPGKPAVTLAVLHVPNALLWGAAPPAPYAGAVELRPQELAPAIPAAVLEASGTGA
jgi:hypothetical protein